MNLAIVMQFIAAHWLLAALFLVLLMGVLSYDKMSNHFSGIAISPHAVVKLINHSHAQVLDIRPAAQFRRGHIINAINVVAPDLIKDLTPLDKFKGRPIVIVCQRDAEGTKLVSILRKSGEFSAVRILTGGMAQWCDVNLPVAKE